jgi:nitroimidazol reductase NimA-like FMN-containing flavoprotein (pyridoxamine 5'-phosphate oxidase superfamily)
MPVVKLPKMSEEDIKSAIKEDNICRIAFIDGDFPYISPFQYVFHNNTLYFHITDYGKKITILEKKKKKNVCVSIEKFEPDLSSYYFISIQGKLERVQKEKEKIEVIKNLIEEARIKYSANFLTAHGFDKNKGWDAFTPDPNLKIYKLKELKRVGLRGMK